MRLPGHTDTRARRRRVAIGLVAAVLGAPLALAQPRTPAEQLVDAAGRGDLAAVRRLLAAGANPRHRPADGRTALVTAAEGNHVAVARALLEAGADVNGIDGTPHHLFMIAAVRGRLELLRLAIEYKANVRAINQYGGTALIPACHYGHVEIVRELLAKTDVPVDHVNRLGWTALLEAVILGDGGPKHTEIVGLLLAHQANPGLADRDGVTPLAHARRRGYRDIVRLLEQAGAK